MKRHWADNDGDKEEIKKEIEKQEQRRSEYKKIEQQLNQSGQTQISTSDPDSRHLITRNNITEVAYSLQTTVDAQNNIPIDYKVTNSNDKKAMGKMLRRAKTILKTNRFTVLYDKGYHTGSELAIADKLGIQAIVAIPPFSGASHAPDLDYDVEHFGYNPKTDTLYLFARPYTNYDRLLAPGKKQCRGTFVPFPKLHNASLQNMPGPPSLYKISS